MFTPNISNNPTAHRHEPWTATHQPSCIENLVLPVGASYLLSHLQRSGGGISLLLHGTPGCGKTAAACLINPDNLYLARIPTDEAHLVEELNRQLSVAAEQEGRLAVVVDDGDNLKPSTQAALCNLIDESTGYADFIITANDPTRLSLALRSRLLAVDLVQEADLEAFEEAESFLRGIATSEGETHVSDVALRTLVESHYPDFRTMLLRLQHDLMYVR